jgi:hypothetical protein
VITTSMLVASFLAAAPPEAPTPAEIAKVYEYWTAGRDAGPILLSVELCADVEKVDGKWACKAPLAQPAKKGDDVVVLFKLFVPKDGKYEDVKLDVAVDGETKLHKEYKVEASWSYGTYAKTKLTKVGAWDVKISRGDQVLGTAKIDVK